MTNFHRHPLVAIVGLFAFVLCLPAPAAADTPATETFVMIVTNNQGSGLGRPDLQYADDDGAKYYEFFSMLAPEENIELLTKFDRDTARLFPRLRTLVSEPTWQNVIASASRFAKRSKAAMAAGKRVEFYFVFAGHGDVDHGRGFVELQDASLGADDLKTYILQGVPSTRTHVIADSCNSYFLIHSRKPGGKRFATPVDAIKELAAELPNVGVFLSTNAESEVFEWSELQSGIFSHAVRSGLAGAADADHNGDVSYQELEAFVATAVVDIKNPLYRPRVFAKAPSSLDTLVHWSASHAVRLVLPNKTAARYALRDREGVPWIDVHTEAESSVLLRLPAALAAGGWIDELSLAGDRATVRKRYPLPLEPSESIALSDLVGEDAASAARGPGDIFHNLFLHPFGAHAMAEFASRQRPEVAVFGISRQDAERMELLLSNIGEVEHRSRMAGTSGLLGVGALSLGAGALLLAEDGESNHSFGLGLAALGGGAFLAGGIGLFVRSPAEKLRERFTSALARGEDPAALVAKTERELYALAADYRRTRHLLGWAGLGMAGVAAGLLVHNELSTDPNRSNSFSFGLLAAAGGWAAFTSQFEYPIEGMVSIWQRDPGIQRLPRLTLVPLREGAIAGLVGSF